MVFGATAGADRASAERDRRWRRYLTQELVPFNENHRRRLDPDRLKSVAALSTVAPMTLDEVEDPRDYLLHPTGTTLSAQAGLDVRARLAWARISGRLARFERGFVERRYKPVHWIVADGLPIGYSTEDMAALAEAGRAGLERAGVRITDTIVSLVPPGPDLGYWQLWLGAQRAGVPIIGLNPSTDAASVAALSPTVLAARPDRLAALAGEVAPPVRLAVCADPPDPTDSEVVSWFAPPGVRSLWSQCRKGAGLHLDPATEVVQAEDGRLIWSSLAWRGTVFMRLDTGLFGTVDESPCPGCGTTEPRVVLSQASPARSERPSKAEAVAAPVPARASTSVIEGDEIENFDDLDVDLERVLDDHPGVKAWQAELRTVAGYDELIIYLAPARGGHPGPLVRELDAELDVTQFVIVDPYDVTDRIEASDGLRVLDLRS